MMVNQYIKIALTDDVWVFVYYHHTKLLATAQMYVLDTDWLDGDQCGQLLKNRIYSALTSGKSKLTCIDLFI